MLICLLLFAAGVSAAGERGEREPAREMPEPTLLQEGQGSGEGVQENAEVMTQNRGEEQQLQVQQREQVQERAQTQERAEVRERQQLRAGNYMTEGGQQLQVQQREQNRVQLMVGSTEATSSLELTQEQVQEKTRLRAKLSNGKDAEIKVMPDTASEKALERLGLKVCNADAGCSIELKEVGRGEQVRAAYEVQAQKQSKLLGLFGKKMQVQAQIDAENGEVIQAKKPWWAFLASEE
ncbi:hypothetical protein KY359_02775 [Candidatus Woesearchaeota archaeon]|nr:hypothetical protein [Candidatus Woesearchaeota archaeon]